ncbi:glycoside hydrolase family 15 protein [Bradyrhizobium ottawaense]|nr:MULTISPECIES: glycoside hydrolase family 15 protein [Bradyrhizobium]MBR1292824.1 glycoside hydrolase family 15 protein [Bradyrhizobium ottawaense]MBR1335318.1 glycoside hydrolase family 15 protein [Bradyrhizobium ottawaense]MDA9465170.1 glucoamylase [Bradyrhizobium sp. CCBAU 53415]PDT86064.1 glycoside hydrolase family 15 protein [Bradyrhizobium sp. Y36]QAU36849.1 glycoside hydrolase family 15 protein [Bradyrhizobium guangdongense]
MPSMARIEDYALIGDCETAGLVGRDGSIDWLCVPRFDSDSCFAKLLGDEHNGYWKICPEARSSSERRYRPGTLILETTFTTDCGRVRLIDLMPPKTDLSKVVRIVEGLEGEVEMRSELVARFDYGTSVPWVSRLEDGAVSMVAGASMLLLRTAVPMRGEAMKTVGSFSVARGETVAFVLSHQISYQDPAAPEDPASLLKQAEDFWRNWSSRCKTAGPYSEAVQRSLITLKALTFGPSGGIVAAATTSLPEQIGGSRNWDYRFCWVRDATLTLLALVGAGFFDEARAWRDWLVRAVAGSPRQLQIMYAVTGERRLTEWEVPWLSGYENSKPVRIGNAAHTQLQLDVYGELMDALYQARRGGLRENKRAWAVQCALLDHLKSIWSQPDEGIWEVRGGAKHFTYSKIMAWVAYDRAIKSAAEFGMKGRVEEWEAQRAAIHDEVCRRGYDLERKTFVQVYGEPQLDASLLLIPAVGFLPPEDPRVISTIQAIERELLQDGFVRRYDTGATKDGLPPGEGMFLACSFWLADAYHLIGRDAEAKELFERLLALRNDVGLLSEEYDISRRRLVGNFPQAFSHIALVNTAHNLTHREKPSEHRGSKRALPSEGDEAARSD